jgi:hypothetical protein
MSYLETFSTWLKTTHLSALMLQYDWVWPTCQILHLIGMALLVGIVGFLDLRILGIGKGIRIGAVHQLLPWGVAGFLINTTTGTLFYIGDPYQYLHARIFQFKMLFIVAAGLNVLYFYVSGLLAKVEALGPVDDAPLSAKVIAGLSLTIWVGVIYLGRMLPFLGDSF